MQELSITNPFGGVVRYMPRTTSTMNAARESPSHGSVLVTSLQTSGRGRISGRVWESPPDQSLLFTLMIDRDTLNVPLTSVSIRTALAITRLLEKRFRLNACIKWPNDVLVDGKKISGILCETAGGYIGIGIGLNCRQKEFLSRYNTSATSVYRETGIECTPLSLLPGLLSSLWETLMRINSSGLPSAADKHLCSFGKHMEVREGDPRAENVVKGVVAGIGEAGELRLRQKNGKIHPVYSGE